MKNLGLYTVLLLLTGCVTTNFKTNTDYAALHRFNRILVVSKLPKAPADWLNAFLVAFPDQYDVCVVDASELAFGNPDSLISQKARECKSDVILTLDFKRNYTVGSGKYISTYNEVFLEMTALPDHKPFWKALVTQNMSSTNIPPDRIVRQLVTDTIIEGKVPNVMYYNGAYHKLYYNAAHQEY